ncbi:calcium-transporting ATPase 1 [Rhizoctonia solani AG-1 IA]|uniref:Calcium-transporting ATPase 1 n=1 Tax=Thanatephorus cucumeris (strain AG1-IA) TaxID=983506 RepID=L8WN81_THACA|nr:calcium-transporting ATPase 1 [Rhizoctonia solani AG-1 IA]
MATNRARINTNLEYGMNRRTGSPPAQAYFETSDEGAPHPVSPEAGSHFAYSTTLRRHGVGESPTTGRTMSLGAASGFVEQVWNSTWNKDKDKDDAYGEEDAIGLALKGRDDTLSAKYASISPEVRVVGLLIPQITRMSRIPRTLYATFAQIPRTVWQLRPSPLCALPLDTTSFRSRYAPEPAWLKFAKTIYESHLILLLFGSAAVSALLGNLDDAISIAVAIFIVVTVGYVQERRSEESLAALNKLVPHHCHILRDGQQVHLLANELVPGDLVTFHVGKLIPLAKRWTLAHHALHLVNDRASHLWGRSSVMVSTRVQVPCTRLELVFIGRGTGIVISTGAETEFGSVFSLMQSVEEKRTPLQASMDELAHKLSMLSFGVIGVICLIGVLQHRGWLEMFTIGGCTVSLAVAAIPEGLPIVTTVTLALGVLRMARRKAIVKKLPSVEALGSVSVICSDKTGTLTQNEQTVSQVFVVDHIVNVETGFGTRINTNMVTPAVRKTLEIGGLCNNAFRNAEGINVGQSTDVAMLNVLAEFGVRDERRQNFTRSSERPFNSESKYMAITGSHNPSSAVAHSRNPSPIPSREMYYIKGALDVLLPLCKTYHIADDATPPLEQGVRQTIMARAEHCAKSGLRVVGVGYAYLPPGYSSTEPPSGLVFAGFEAMMDPPRKGVSEAVAQLHAGGVKVVMITGDATHTAQSIAQSIGLRTTGVGASAGLGMGLDMSARIGMGGIGLSPRGASAASGSCLTGAEIDAMDDRSLMERVSNVTVFARTTPRHKMRIVKAYQQRGEVVAMTGDGVNDAPALKMADIGVSMGKSGTDVAKEAADVILVDDNFSTILSAVEEGSTAVAALTLITLSTMFRLSNPLNAMQILFINILMDGPPSQSLGVDPVDRAVMKRPPRRKDEPIITQRIVGRVLFSASIIVLGIMFVYAHELSDGSMSRRDQTMTFTCFVFLDLASALQNRGINCGLFQNQMLLTTVSVSFLVQLGFIYIPLFQSVFQTEALPAHDMSVLLCLGAVSMGLHELRRRWERKTNKEMDASYSGGIGDVV